MHIPYRVLGFPISAAVLLAASQLSIAGQMPPGAASEQAPPSVSSPAQDKFLMLVQPRDTAEIQRDIESAEQSRMAATEAEGTAKEQRSAAAARIEEKKQAISANKDRLKTAKNAKNESEILLLKTEGKALERDKNLYEEREALRDAEIDLAIKRKELASLMRQAFDLERQLAIKRVEQPETGVSGPETARVARVLIDLEKATLEMQKKVADKQSEVADGAKKVVERQLKTLEAQQNIYAGK
jgi:hypothetical protein